ncbi:MAG: hypothetical protein ACHP7K_06305 [Actinomycetales bacterium]|jgi:hypothetical protein
MIDWQAFISVAITTLVASMLVVTLYSAGVRLYAVSADKQSPRPGTARSAAYACFVVCGAAVLFGIYLIIPFFHH